MKTKLSLILIIILSFSLVACSSGVSKEEYNAIISERDIAREERDRALDEKDKLIAEKDDYKNSYEKEKEKNKELISSKPDLTDAMIWAEVAFGDNISIDVIDQKYLEIIVPTENELSEENIRKCLSDFMASLKTLSFMYKSLPDSFNFDRIAVSFLDENGSEMFESELLKGEDGYVSGTTTISMTDVEIIYDGMTKALKKQ